MEKHWIVLAAAAAVTLTACGPSQPADSQPQSAPPPAQPAPAVETGSTPEPSPSSPALSVQQASETAVKVAGDLTSNFTASLNQTSDTVLKGLGGDLTGAVEKLQQALKSEEPLQNTLRSAMDALGNGQDSQALGLFQKVSQAKLTEDQLHAATEVKNVFNAFVVQRNFSTLPGAETQVSKLVQSLKQADTAGALTQLKEIAGSAQLTPAQKDLLNSVAQQYGPSLKDAGQAVQEGLKGLFNK